MGDVAVVGTGVDGTAVAGTGVDGAVVGGTGVAGTGVEGTGVDGALVGGTGVAVGAAILAVGESAGTDETASVGRARGVALVGAEVAGDSGLPSTAGAGSILLG